ncbi:inositol 1,4,5-triphosphate receptor associated 2-like, partial [Centroberyx affinis]|uniref:inositol 1,4,5-triphosphate receptor associated 2-like n=1 Tax=Centroberyx affinis TaxID=166261 RepID=UPI003A5BDA32
KDQQKLYITICKYTALFQLLRADKTKLENQIQMMHPDMAGASLSLSAAYRLNQTGSGSLQTELALAQSPLEPLHGVANLSSTMNFASPLDETLDREVLLLMQGPSPEHMALEFKSLLNKLRRDFREETVSVLSAFKGLLDDNRQQGGSADTSLQTVQAELDARRADWGLGLDQLAQYTDSLEKELIKMASNMRRSRTEILHLSVRVQEQENQKRQMCDELEQLKTPQDSREASCQTPDLGQEPGEDLDWDEEFALQDFLKNEIAERNCRAQDGRTDSRHKEATGRLTDRGEEEEEEEGEERWTVVDTGGEREARATSTPLSAHFVEAQPGESAVGEGQDSTAYVDSQPEVVNCQPSQEEAKVALNAHSQAVSIGHQETDALSDPSHSENSDAAKSTQPLPDGSVHNLTNSPELDRTVTPDNTPDNAPPRAPEMVPPNSASPAPDETVSQSGSRQPPSEDRREAGGGEKGGEKGGEADSTTGDMSFTKSLSQDQSADRALAEDSTSLLPVLVEEEEGVQDITEAPAVTVSMAGTDRLTGNGATTLSGGSSPQSATGPTVTRTGQSGAGVESATSDPSQSEDSALGGQAGSGAKKDSLSLRGKNKRELELSRSMEAIEEHKAQEELSESSMATEKETETSVISDTSDSFREDRNSLSPTDKEIETEFQRLSLGFKCDMFTLEKRLRLEERSRDLAEENVRREVSSCQGLLQALIPLCEDESMEIIQRLQKNLDILIQSMTRVSSRSEMLGAIHQESRIGKAVEVMIQHVENLRRMYTKEHAELLELREALMQNERSFGSQTGDDFRGKKPSSQYYKSSSRRVSIAAIPRSGGGNMHFDLPKLQDGSEDSERLTRRSPWNVAGKNTARPPLKRFVSSAAWVDTEEPSLMMKGTACIDSDSQSDEEQRVERVTQRRRSSLTELGNILASLILPLKTRQDELFVMLPSPSSSPTITEPVMAPSLSQSLTSSRAATSAAVARGSRGVWLWLAMVVVLAGLLALLASLVMQPAVDAAPVGTGDSWMTIQQLLWPYTGLRHNGQPPV